MSRKRPTPRNRRLFILTNTAALVLSALLLPLLWAYVHQGLLLPAVLASMVSGMVTGLLLGLVQQETRRRFQRDLYPFWVSTTVWGGFVGGLAAGAGHIFLQSLSSAVLPVAVPFIGIFAFIGLFQWNVLHDEGQRELLWPLLLAAFGVVAVQGGLLLPLVPILAFAAATRLERLRPPRTEHLPEVERQQPNIARLQLPESTEAQRVPAAIHIPQDSAQRRLR